MTARPPLGALLLIGSLSIAPAPANALQPAADSGRRPALSADDSIHMEREVYHFYRLHGRYRTMEEFRERFRQGVAALPNHEWFTSLRVDNPVPGMPSLASREGHATCGGSRWWCDLLFVYLNASRDSLALADSMLLAAQERMPPGVRCVWGDVSGLIADNDLRKRYEAMSCDERRAFEDRFWWLADPHHSVLGNERRTDHVARAVGLRLDLETRLFPRLAGWGWGLTMVRRVPRVFGVAHPEEMSLGEATPDSLGPEMSGPAVFLRRVRDEMRRANPSNLGPNGAYVTSERRYRMVSVRRVRGGVPLQFAPGPGAIAQPFLAEPSEWDISALKPHETGFATVRGSHTPLDHQHAFFLRDDSARLVVVSEVPRGSPLDRGLLRAALAVSRSPYESPRIVRLPGGPRFPLSMTVPADSMLVSLEVFSLGANWGRARFGAVPPFAGRRLRLSDVALFDPRPGTAPPTIALDSIVARMHSTTRYAAGSSIGLFWEVYGLREGETPSFAVTAVREASTGLVRSALSPFIGRPAADSALRVAWIDLPAAGRAIEPRTIALNLSTLEPGRYMLTLRAMLPGEEPAVVTRRIEIDKPR